MKSLLILLGLLLTINVGAQTIGSTKTEQFKASFETKIDISQFLNYEGPTIPIQILKCGIGDDLYESYPELKEKKVGLGVANITMEYLENLNRFTFTEDKTEIKNRMVKQFQASQSGISQDKLDGRGKIRLAHYFVEIEVYDFSVSEDETVNLSNGVKNKVVTRLGLQVRFTNAENGTYFVGSGLGEANTIKTQEGLLGLDLEEINFRQSAIGVTTRQALETASARIVARMIRKKIFEN